MSVKQIDLTMDNLADTFGNMLKTCSNCIKPAKENVTFMPCKHKVTCLRCSKTTRKCFKCRADIQSRVTPGGLVIKTTSTETTGIESFLKRINNSLKCRICSKDTADVVFLCGHKACSSCSQKLSKCHICKKHINHKIKMY